MKVFVALLTVVVVAALVFFGTDKLGIWAKVGNEALAEKIDEALGSFKVRRAEAGKAVSRLEASVAELREGQLKAEVEAEQVADEREDIDGRAEDVKEALARHRDLIAAGEPAVIGGKTYEKEQLQIRADRLIEAWKSLDTRRQALEKAHDILVKSARSLEERVSKRKAQVRALKARLDEIDAKIVALNTLRKAAETASGDGESLEDSFSEAERSIRNLYASVETGLRVEEEQWNEAGEGTEKVDDILEQAKSPESTVDRIDEILKAE